MLNSTKNSGLSSPSVVPGSGGLVKDVIIYGLGDAIIRGLGVVTVPIFTRYFSPGDYGIMSLLIAFISLFGLIHDAGMASAAQRQYFDHQDPKSGHRATTTAFWFVVVWGTLLMIIGLLLGNVLAQLLLKDPDRGLLIWLVIATSFVAVIAQLVRSFFRLTFRAWPFALTALISGLATIGLSVVFVIRGEGLTGYFWGGFLGAVIGASVTLLLGRNFLTGTVDRGQLRAMLRYGLPLVPAALAGFIFDLSDRFFLARLYDFQEVGLYAVGYSVVGLLSLAIGAFGQAWAPFALAHHAEKPADAPQLFARFLLYVVVAFSFLALAVTIFGDEILRLLTTPAFYGAAEVIPLLALSYVAFATTQITTLGMSIARKTTMIAVGAGGAAIINVVGNLLLIPRWGMLGAAWATLIAYLALTLFYGALSQRELRCPWPWRQILLTGLLTVGLTIGAGRLPSDGSLGQLLLQVGYLFLFPLGLWLLRIFRRDEWQIVRQIFLFDLAFWKKRGGVPENISV